MRAWGAVKVHTRTAGMMSVCLNRSCHQLQSITNAHVPAALLSVVLFAVGLRALWLDHVPGSPRRAQSESEPES